MGLAEKRIVKDFQDNSYPGFRDKIVSTLGFEPDIEVKWDTMAVFDGKPQWMNIGGIYFEPVVKAFESLCADDMGKEALKDALKKIVIQNEKNNTTTGSWATFGEGELTLEHDPMTNAGEVAGRANTIVKVLEKAL